MKRVVVIFIGVALICFLGMCFLVNNNFKYYDKMILQIKEKCGIDNIKYINKYNNYYVVLNDDYIYVLDSKYKEILKIDNALVHENKNHYDIIYDDKVMYMNDIKKGDMLVYTYYDLYTYKEISSVVLGE